MPHQNDSITVRELIVSTTAQLYATRGIQATSLGVIAQQSNISKGTLYYYFPNKDDLMKEVCQTLLLRLRAELSTWESLVANMPCVVDALCALSDILLSGSYSNKLHFEFVAEAARQSSPIHEMYIDFCDTFTRIINQILAKISKSSCIDFAKLAAMYLVTLNGYISQSLMQLNYISKDDFLECISSWYDYE